MHLHYLVFFCFVALAQAKLRACNYFAPRGPNTVEGQCDIFPGYPHNFGSPESTKVIVLYTTKWKKSGGKASLTAPVLQDALSKSIDYYNKFAFLPPQVFVILTDGTREDYMDTFYPLEQKSSFRIKSPCQIRSFRLWTQLVAANAAQAMQVLAHEMYHCVQGWSQLGNRGGGIDWLLDGSADYFSNLVYPYTNFEWENPYDPKQPIYAQSYATTLFFQALEQKKMTPLQINKWVLSTDPTKDVAAERTRLSKLSGFTDDFFFFAEIFSLKTIQDTSGVIIPNLPDIVMAHVPLKLDASGKAGTATLETVPFTITVFELSVDHGQTVLISATANSHQRLAYRRPSDEIWTEMKNGPAKGPQPAHVIKCQDEGDTGTILVLFISTADTSSSKAKVTITHQSSDPKCSCKNSHGTQRRALQSCQRSSSGGFTHWPLPNPNTSGGYCPDGTHPGARAIWCCPGGTELDETVLSEMAICCPTSTDCSKKIVPNHMRCADPSWVLWSRDFRDIGCCKPGYVPNSLRFCVQGSTPGPGFSTIPQTSVATPIVAKV